MNHECIKDLSMNISIEFKDQVSCFLSKGYSESKILVQVRGGGGLLLKSKHIFCPVRVCSYFRQHLPVKECQTGS